METESRPLEARRPGFCTLYQSVVVWEPLPWGDISKLGNSYLLRAVLKRKPSPASTNHSWGMVPWSTKGGLGEAPEFLLQTFSTCWSRRSQEAERPA